MDPLGLVIEVAVGLMADRAVDWLREWAYGDARRRDLADALKAQLIEACGGRLELSDGVFDPAALLVWLRQPTVVEALAQPTSDALAHQRNSLASAWRPRSYEHARYLTDSELGEATRILHLLAVSGALPSGLRSRVSEQIHRHLQTRVEDLPTRGQLKQEIDVLLEAVLATYEAAYQRTAESEATILAALDPVARRVTEIHAWTRASGWPAGWIVTPPRNDDGGLADLQSQEPPASGSRDRELEQVTRLLGRSKGGGVVIRGDVFRGKTTMVAELVRRLGANNAIDLVVLMNVRNSGHLPTRPLEVLNTQLIDVIGAECGLADSPEGLVEQHRVLRDRAAIEGHHVVILIDALDEAPDPSLLAAALAQPPPQGCWVVVSTRPNPPLPSAHFLEKLPQSHKIDMKEVPQAVARKDAADAWVDAIASSSDPVEHRVFAAIAGAGRPLSRLELADLTGIERAAVNGVLQQDQHQPWFTRSDKYGRTRLGHDYVASALATQLGSGLMSSAEAQLRAWADRYRAAAWPTDTPRYLLEYLPTRPDPTRLAEEEPPFALTLDERTQLVLERDWTERRYAVLGQRRLLAELGNLTLNELAQEHASGRDRLAELVAVALLLRRWRRATSIPLNLIMAYASQGQIDLAFDLAQDAANPQALLTLASHPNVPSEARSRLVAEGFRLARLRTQYLSPELLASAAATLATTNNIVEARQIADGLRPPDRAEVLVAIGRATQNPSVLQEARQMADGLRPPDRAEVLVAIGSATQNPSVLQEARQTAGQLGVGRTSIVARIETAMVATGKALAARGRIAEARQVADDLPHGARAQVLVAVADAEDDPELLSEVLRIAGQVEPRYRRAVLLGIAQSLAEVGRIEDARWYAKKLADRDRVHACLAIGKALAGRGRIAEARQVADDLPPWERAQVLVAIGEAGEPDALTEARTLVEEYAKNSDSSQDGIETFMALGTALITSDRANAARQLLDDLDPFHRVKMLVAIGKAGDGDALTGAYELAATLADDTRRRLEQFITVSDWQRRAAYVAVGKAFAARDRIVEARQVADDLPPSGRAQVLVAIGEAGNLDALTEARELAARLPAFERTQVLWAIGKAFAARSRVVEARQVADDLPPRERAQVLVAIGEAAQDANVLQEARSLADDLPPWERAKLLATTGWTEEARRVADELEDWDRPEALMAIGKALAARNHLAEARQVADDLPPSGRAQVLVAMGKAGDLEAFRTGVALSYEIEPRPRAADVLVEAAKVLTHHPGPNTVVERTQVDLAIVSSLAYRA